MQLTQLEFDDKTSAIAHDLAKHLGYKQTAYTSTSALVGLYCLPENPEHSKGPARGGCIINTKEVGMLFVQTNEDLDRYDLFQRENA